MVESLVEAVLRRRLEERQHQVEPGVRAAELPTEARTCPACGGPARQDNPGACEKCRPVTRCLCGCGRPVDRRNRLGVSKRCTVTVVEAFRDAPEPVRRALRKLMAPAC